MIEHKTLPGEIIVELRNLLISIVRKDTRNDTDTLPGGNILWLNADRTLEDYPATFIVPPPKFADCIEPFSPGGPLDWRGSARWCGGDWAGAGVVRAGAARDSVF